jgi:hypothetical protein
MRDWLQRSARGVVANLRHALQNPKPARILFEHLPKCGGTTVTAYLSSQYRPRLVYEIDGRHPTHSIERFRSLSQAERYQYHLVTGHLTDDLIDHVHPDTIKLTIFRDPVRRIVSHYFFVREDPLHYLHDAVVRGGVTLEDYGRGDLSSELRNWYTSYFSRLSPRETRDDPERALTVALRRIRERYDIVGFLDRLPAAMDELRLRAHLRGRFSDRRLNQTPGRPPFSEIPESTLAIIAAVNDLDLKLYAALRDGKGQP